MPAGRSPCLCTSPSRAHLRFCWDDWVSFNGPDQETTCWTSQGRCITCWKWVLGLNSVHIHRQAHTVKHTCSDRFYFFLPCLSFIWLSFEMIFLYSLISISSSLQLQCWCMVLRLSLGKRVHISAGEISSGFPVVRSCWNRACHWIGQTLCKAQPTQDGKIRLGSEKHRLSPSKRSRKNWNNHIDSWHQHSLKQAPHRKATFASESF